jgi:hypothetical protein
MFATSKLKWFASLLLGGVLLALALTGGKWGTTYSASASIADAPHIDSIDPSLVPSGSPDIVMIIFGSNFGDTTDTRVRLLGNGMDLILAPLVVIQNGISVVISDTLLVNPTFYSITVLKSTKHTIPTIPPSPWDQESNPAAFFVYGASYIHLPIISKNAVP